MEEFNNISIIEDNSYNQPINESRTATFVSQGANNNVHQNNNNDKSCDNITENKSIQIEYMKDEELNNEVPQIYNDGIVENDDGDQTKLENGHDSNRYNTSGYYNVNQSK